MKKYGRYILICILAFFIQINAFGLEVQPTMMSRSNDQNRVWVGSFQIVWNEFIDKYVHQPVRFREGTPSSVQALNIRKFTTKHLSDKCYYVFTGKITNNTKSHIENAIKSRRSLDRKSVV